MQVEIDNHGPIDVMLEICVHRPDDHIVDVAEATKSAPIPRQKRVRTPTDYPLRNDDLAAGLRRTPC